MIDENVLLGWGKRGRGLVMISQVRWREGVKEEIPNLLVYHAKAQFSSYHQLPYSTSGRIQSLIQSLLRCKQYS